MYQSLFDLKPRIFVQNKKSANLCGRNHLKKNRDSLNFIRKKEKNFSYQYKGMQNKIL